MDAKPTRHETVRSIVAHRRSRSVRTDEGQTLVEYAMILGLIVLVVAALVALLHGPLSNMFSSIGSAI